MRVLSPLLCILALAALRANSAAAFGELSTAHLRACVLLEKPYVIRDSTRRSGYSGLALDYLERMRDNLQFSVDYRHWNNTWSDFIDVMSVCGPGGPVGCPCDIGLGSFTMTNARAESINFVWPFASEAHQMVTRRSAMRVDDSKNAWFVFRIFPAEVWASICAIVVLHAIGTLIYTPSFNIFPTDRDHHSIELGSRNVTNNNTNKPTTPNPTAPTEATEAQSISSIPSTQSSSNSASFELQERKPQPAPPESQIRRAANRTLYVIYRFPYAILYAYSHLLGESIAEDCDDEREAEKRPSIHRLAWMLLGITCGVFMLTVYEAGLTVLLFESEKTSPFDNLADITDCHIDPSRIAMIHGGASQEFWNSAVNTTKNRARCGWKTAGVTVRNLEDGFSALYNEKIDLFYSLEGSVRFRANGDCEKFEAAGAPFFSTAVAFVMPRRVNRTVLNRLNIETRVLIEQNEFPPASVIATRSECRPEIDPVVRVGKLSAFFSMYICVWLSLLLFRIVFVYRRWRQKRAVAQDGPELARTDSVVLQPGNGRDAPTAHGAVATP